MKVKWTQFNSTRLFMLTVF
uniref:Uncharacterized protein n=1 Tax=Rhizophora mucronata TaxID=61149 RepID=A0A2P2N468_RHIMU